MARDAAAQEATGKTLSELEMIAEQWQNTYNAAAAAYGQNANTATKEGDGVRYQIKSVGDKKYVQADRQVIFGNNPESWSEQLENYINTKIRNGENVTLIAEDGDVLTLTKDTAGKISDPHTSDGRTMSESEFERKVSAGAHIDELAQISKRGKKNTEDYSAKHGDMASGGWNYRTAFFRDFDGKYYRVRISVAIGGDGNIVYNIGEMQERSFPQVNGSSGNSGAQQGKTSFPPSVPNLSDGVKGNLSQLKSTAPLRQMMRDIRMPRLTTVEQDAAAAAMVGLEAAPAAVKNELRVPQLSDGFTDADVPGTAPLTRQDIARELAWRQRMESEPAAPQAMGELRVPNLSEDVGEAGMGSPPMG